ARDGAREGRDVNAGMARGIWAPCQRSDHGEAERGDGEPPCETTPRVRLHAPAPSAMTASRAALGAVARGTRVATLASIHSAPRKPARAMSTTSNTTTP